MNAYQGIACPPDKLNLELHSACMTGDPARVRQLLLMGANPHARTIAGATAVEVADFLQRVDIIKYLLCYVNVPVTGLFELMRAIRLGRATVVRALLEMGVNQQLLDESHYRGILLLTCCTGTALVIDALIKHGPGFITYPHEDLYVQVALSAGRLDVVEVIHRISDAEKRIFSRDIQDHMLPDESSASTIENIVVDDPFAEFINWDE